MPFEWLVALRFLREGRAQTALILGGIGVGVGVIIFLSALITALQTSLIERTTGTQAQIVVRPTEDEVRPLVRAVPGPGGIAPAPRIERPPQRLRSILNGTQAMAAIARLPRVTAVAPTVAGPAFALRGAASSSVALRGVEIESYRRILDLAPRLTSGAVRLRGTDAMIGVELAKDLGVGIGDKLRIAVPEGRRQVFSITGIFDVGNRDLNKRWVFVSLRSAQTLLGLAGGISTLEVKVDEIFAAEEVARTIHGRTGLIADSWMQTNSQLLTGLRSQSSSSSLIQVFVIVAVALGIASVLIVSVVQKSREIGILRAMGTSTRRVVRIFLIEGAILGLGGSLVGIAFGSALALFFASLAKNPDGTATFPVALGAGLFLRSAAIATAVGLLSAVLPARRAAQLDPAEVIRYG